jgi:O-antigen ligase
LYGGYADGRFVIQQTSLENPNDLAFQILLDGAFLLFLVFRRSWIARGLWVLTVPLSLMYILKTASRASFVTIVAATILAWALSPRTTKVLFLAIWPAMLVLAALFVPSYTWSRLRLITADPESEIYSTGDVQLRAALESQMARQQLQRRAIELTLRHPLLGVGPQMFADAADSLVQMQTGRKSGWQAPHNVYLQVSSENGIPALIFYLWTIAACFRMNYRSFQRCKGIPGQELNRAQSFCLLLAVFVYSIGVLFCNVTYFSYLSLLVGFSSANYLAIEKERKEDRTTATASFASPVPQIA